MPAETGPVIDAQVVAPPVPKMLHVIAPVGASALAAPETVVVNSTEPPRVGVLVETFNIVGTAVATTVDDEDVVVPTAL